MDDFASRWTSYSCQYLRRRPTIAGARFVTPAKFETFRNPDSPAFSRCCPSDGAFTYAQSRRWLAQLGLAGCGDVAGCVSRLDVFLAIRSSWTSGGRVPRRIWWLDIRGIHVGLAADPATAWPLRRPVVLWMRCQSLSRTWSLWPIRCSITRLGLTVRELVLKLEQAVIDQVAAHGIAAAGRRDAPGVYVEGRKLASLGLRIRRGTSYHGVALNVNMDLAPFACINPCGMPGMQVTQLADLGSAGCAACGARIRAALHRAWLALTNHTTPSDASSIATPLALGCTKARSPATKLPW